MLKQVLYYLLLLTTGMRFVGMIYLLAKEELNLPITVIALTSVMILYGVFLVLKKFVTGIGIKPLMCFYMIQTGVVIFNIAFVALTSPLQIQLAETLIVGTFLDVLVNFILIVLAVRHLRNGFAAAIQNPTVKGQVNHV